MYTLVPTLIVPIEEINLLKLNLNMRYIREVFNKKTFDK